MKIKSILLPITAMLALVGCSSNEGTGPGNTGEDVGKAYISINVQTPYIPGSRASEENPGATPLETDIKLLYAVTFDASDKIITYGNNTPAARKVDVTSSGLRGRNPNLSRYRRMRKVCC